MFTFRSAEHLLSWGNPMRSRYGNFILVLFQVLFLGPSFPRPVFALPPFVNEFVDVSGRTRSYSSLALDARGNPSIACQAQNGTLTYAHRDGGIWSFENPDPTITSASFISLALDSDGNPNIAFFDATSSSLRLCRRTAGSWVFETIDNAGTVGWWASLKLDANGNPRVAYYDLTNSDLKYAAKNSGVWVSEVVASTGTVGEYCSLALDSQGYPRISYYDGTNNDLRYASKTTGSWSTELVDGAGFVGPYTSLALDAQDAPRISYFDGTNGDVKYATKASGAWQLEVVNTNAANSWTAIALDAQGVPVVAYYDGLLKYASRATGTWVSETADAEGATGWYVSLVLDAQGNPRMAYQDISSSNSKYADAAVHVLSPRGGERWPAGSSQTVQWSGAGSVDIALSSDGGAGFVTVATGQTGGRATISIPNWTSERVKLRISRVSPASTDQSPGVFAVAPGLVSPWWSIDAEPISPGASEAALALDADGSPHLALSGYHSYRSGRSWSYESVDYQMSYQSIQIDVDGTPDIAYFHGVENALKFAYRPTGTWSTSAVDHGSFRDISLALGPGGRMGIAYYDVTNGDLKFASGSPGNWTIETVDGTGGVNVGEWASLQIIPRSITGTGQNTGTPVIAYYDRTNGNLKLATKGTFSWTIEVLDSPGDVGYYASLALDHQGYPVVAYMDNSNGGRVRLARKGPNGWTLETVFPTIGYGVQLVLDGMDDPHIIFSDPFGSRVRVATKRSGVWFYDTIDPTAGTSLGTPHSLRLDAYGNARWTWYDSVRQRMLYGSSALEIGEPRLGDTWTVGASHAVTWDGAGLADISLSVDGGLDWEPVATGVTGGSYRVIVPHSPSRFCRYRVERTIPHSVSATAGLFSIQSNISLLALSATYLSAEPGMRGSVLLSWSTDPKVGPEGIAGYRLYRTTSADPDLGQLVGPDLITDTTYVDREGNPGSGYRLTALNHLMEESEIGRTSLRPARALSAWPVPYRDGSLNVSFATFGGLLGGDAQAEVTVRDLSGRLVRTLAKGMFAAGLHTTAWDGRDARNVSVPNGVYFMEARTAGQRAVTKIAVVR